MPRRAPRTPPPSTPREPPITPAAPRIYARIAACVCRIPRGRVATYGDVARRVGGCTARQVGYAMAALPQESRVPWHRVINHRGEVSARSRDEHGALVQRVLLEREGLRFDAKGRISLARYRWSRRPSPPGRKRAWGNEER